MAATPPLQPPTPLILAIATLTPASLREVLIQMCALSPETKRIAESILLVPSSSIYSPITPIATSGRKRKLGEVSNGIGSGRKGKLVPRFASCMQCDVQFDVTENEEGGCFWHEGIFFFFLFFFPSFLLLLTLDVDC